MSTLPDPIDMSVADAATRLGIDPKTIRRMISRGDLPARRLGPRLIRIRVVDLNALGSPLGPGSR